jgi:SOS response regulatory protein OraA/RecX
MMTSRISALVPDPRRAGAVRVEVDGAVLCVVARADAAAMALVPGAIVDEVLHERLNAAADTEAAFRTALRALERRSFGRIDLGRRLVRKGHPAPAVELALGRLVANGLLDDAAFALNYAEVRSSRGRGPVRVRRDLAAMGVEREAVDRAMAVVWPPDVDNGLRALELARSRAGRLTKLPRVAQRRRLLAFLARRGYTGDIAHKAVAALV